MDISQIHNPWRDKLRPASFRGAPFFVEVSQKASGRRQVIHQFPKRDVPYAEDMGREAQHFVVTAYVIGPNYLDQRDALENALDTVGPGQLQLPTRSSQIVVVDGLYRSEERRELGGYCMFEIPFTEAGQQLAPTQSTSQAVTSNALVASNAAISSLDTQLAASTAFSTPSQVFGG